MWNMVVLHTRQDIDHDLLASYVGALFDDCHDCRLAFAAEIAEYPATTGSFVALVGAGVLDTLGPAALRKLAARSEIRPMLADHPPVLYDPTIAACQDMSVQQRVAAVEFSAGVLAMTLGAALANMRSKRPN